MPDPARAIFADWTLPIGLTLSIAVAAAIYLRGWFAIRRTRPGQFTGLRLASFLSGLALLWIAIASPMDGFADTLLTAHMLEHLLLMSAIPMLLLYGLPVVPLLRGLPWPLTRWIAAPLLRARLLRRFAHWLVTPAIAWLLMNVGYLAWHVPAAYDLALENETVHAIERPALPRPLRHRHDHALRLPHLLRPPRLPLVRRPPQSLRPAHPRRPGPRRGHHVGARLLRLPHPRHGHHRKAALARPPAPRLSRPTLRCHPERSEGPLYLFFRSLTHFA